MQPLPLLLGKLAIFSCLLDGFLCLLLPFFFSRSLKRMAVPTKYPPTVQTNRSRRTFKLKRSTRFSSEDQHSKEHDYSCDPRMSDNSNPVDSVTAPNLNIVDSAMSTKSNPVDSDAASSCEPQISCSSWPETSDDCGLEMKCHNQEESKKVLHKKLTKNKKKAKQLHAKPTKLLKLVNNDRNAKVFKSVKILRLQKEAEGMASQFIQKYKKSAPNETLFIVYYKNDEKCPNVTPEEQNLSGIAEPTNKARLEQARPKMLIKNRHTKVEAQ